MWAPETIKLLSRIKKKANKFSETHGYSEIRLKIRGRICRVFGWYFFSGCIVSRCLWNFLGGFVSGRDAQGKVFLDDSVALRRFLSLKVWSAFSRIALWLHGGGRSESSHFYGCGTLSFPMYENVCLLFFLYLTAITSFGDGEIRIGSRFLISDRRIIIRVSTPVYSRSYYDYKDE